VFDIRFRQSFAGDALTALSDGTHGNIDPEMPRFRQALPAYGLDLRHRHLNFDIALFLLI
jgi:hypothetical protein